MNEHIRCLGSRRSQPPTALGKDCDTDLMIERMRVSVGNLLRRISESNGRVAELEATEVATDGTLIRSNALLGRMSSDLRAKNCQIERLEVDLMQANASVKGLSKKLLKTNMEREQFAIDVTNSICAGYINIVVSGVSVTDSPERRFVVVSFADAKIYDYTLCTVVYRLLVDQYHIGTVETDKQISYIWKCKQDSSTFSFIIPQTTCVFSKWTHAMDMLTKSRDHRMANPGGTHLDSFPTYSVVVPYENDSSIGDTITSL